MITDRVHKLQFDEHVEGMIRDDAINMKGVISLSLIFVSLPLLFFNRCFSYVSSFFLSGPLISAAKQIRGLCSAPSAHQAV